MTNNEVILSCPCCEAEMVIDVQDLLAALGDERTGQHTEEPWEESTVASPQAGDEVQLRADGNYVKVTRGISNHSGHFGGLQVETAVSGTNTGNSRSVRRIGQAMAGLPTVNVTRRKAPTFSVEAVGEDAGGDVIPGLTGREAHFESLQQAHYEDLIDRGFNPQHY